MVRAVGVLEELIGSNPVSDDAVLVATLHELYRRAFTAFSVKGVTEGNAHSNRDGGSREAVSTKPQV